MKHRKELFFSGIALAVVVVDQLIKKTVQVTIPLHEEWFKQGALFAITYSQNTGASFGILQGKTTFLIWFSLIVLGGILWYLRKTPQEMTPFVALIAGGAVSNVIDRVNLGYVVDYLDVWIIPTFNIADLAITVGAIGVGWLLYFKKE